MATQKAEQKTDQKSNKQTKSTGTGGGTSGVVECGKVNAKNLTFTDLDTKNARSAAQSIAYPNYEYIPNVKKNFIFKTDIIQISQYGIPMMNDKTKEWIKSDKDREYFRLGHDKTQASCNSLFKMLKDIDARVLELMPVIFGANANKYKYIPLVKEASESEEEEVPEKGDSIKPKVDKMNFCKVKLDTDYNDDRRITTAIFVTENGKPVLQENVNTVSDVAEHLTWNSSARFVIMMNKLWAEKVPKKGKGQPKEFGISMKCLQLEVTDKSAKSGSVKAQFQKSFAFGDSGYNSESESKPETKSDTKSDTKADIKADIKSDAKQSKQDTKKVTKQVVEDEVEVEEVEETEGTEGTEGDEEEQVEEEEEQVDEEEQEDEPQKKNKTRPHKNPHQNDKKYLII
jgi:hypothetical protein